MNHETIQQHQDAVFPPIQPYALKSRKNTRLTTMQKIMLSYAGAGLCFVSEFIHLWLLPEQYEIYLVYGIIFLLVAMTQGVIGANLLFEPRRRLLTFGLWVNVLIIMLYGFTHTIGVLVGLAFLPLPIDAPGIAATMAEVVAVIILLFLQRDSPHIRRNQERKGATTKRSKNQEACEKLNANFEAISTDPSRSNPSLERLGRRRCLRRR